VKPGAVTLPDLTPAPQAALRPGRVRLPTGRLAWRNLWRNRRRTWLTAGGIGFAVWMLVFVQSLQEGTYGTMVDNTARLGVGHLQIQHPAFQDDPQLEHLLDGASERLRRVEADRAVSAVLPRAQSFALASAGERSYGALVIGVDAARERAASSLVRFTVAGRYLEAPGEAFLGSVLARNLGVAVGDEVVFLGTALEGGVAAGVARVVGIFESGQTELDRSLLQVPLDDFREAWGLTQDQLHALVVLLHRAADTERVAARLAAPDHAVPTWKALMPEARQTIDLKVVSARLMFALVAVIVTFSVVNTFMMTVFERTPEFGMLMALGMRPRGIVVQLRIEAFWMCALGVGIGLAVGAVAVGALSRTGLPLPGDASEILARFNLDRVYPAFSAEGAWTAVVVMLLGTQLAVWIPALRIRRLRPVDALRARE
jgi:putative ABC transport system permease protein